ncbi:hypothetical protein D9619_011418 [Psilocybe cf. subviscida]|uniref:Uncharacterized protein n=1 Tax=Psilocybe cf. subviscida TaxID=2480587 RepID=A0A8H5F5T9_9AGAR|nr:hypothetical protein D9619_011418 [Psilocybe cf. subviscida]
MVNDGEHSGDLAGPSFPANQHAPGIAAERDQPFQPFGLSPLYSVHETSHKRYDVVFDTARWLTSSRDGGRFRRRCTVGTAPSMNRPRPPLFSPPSWGVARTTRYLRLAAFVAISPIKHRPEDRRRHPNSSRPPRPNPST